MFVVCIEERFLSFSLDMQTKKWRWRRRRRGRGGGTRLSWHWEQVNLPVGKANRANRCGMKEKEV